MSTLKRTVIWVAAHTRTVRRKDGRTVTIWVAAHPRVIRSGMNKKPRP
jgi:hypothetical protein